MRIRTEDDFGAVARQRRRDLGLSQAELAQRAGVTRQWLVRFERGNSEVTLSKVFVVLRELGLLVSTEPAESPIGVTEAQSGDDGFTFPKVRIPSLTFQEALQESNKTGSQTTPGMIVALSLVSETIRKLNADYGDSGESSDE